MIRKPLVVISIIMLIASVLVGMQRVSAGGSANITSADCNHVNVQGTTNEQYIELLVDQISSNSGAVSDIFSNTGGAPIGSFSLSVGFPVGLPNGTSYRVRVFDLDSTLLSTNVTCGGSGGSGGSGAGAAGSGYSGPSIPPGFILGRFLCTTPIFNSPGGIVVGTGLITVGQTWFVWPHAIRDHKGKYWLRTFVGGYGLGYVPNNCVHLIF
jgi:hypothetical protein